MVGQRRGHPGIDDDEVHSRPTRHDVDRRTARQEVQHHLGRDFLGVPRDPLSDHAVIGSGHNDGLPSHRWLRSTEYARQLDGQFFQPAQAARRFGQTVLAKLGRSFRLGIGRCNTDKNLV